MRALVVTPLVKNSARLAVVPDPSSEDGTLLVEMLAIGVCGTDREIVQGLYGAAPPGRRDLVIGHESLGRVLETSDEKKFPVGSLVVGFVRRPDPIPCSACAMGEWDMCKNGLYTERGIKERDGYASEWYRLEPEFTIPVPARLGERAVLVEPASVVAKAWDHTERIGRRAHFAPRRVLVTGAGPIGLLATLMAIQRGLETHVLDRVTSGPKPDLVKALGARYHSDVSSLGSLRDDIDIVMECTGAAKLVLEVREIAGPDSVVCLTGVSSGSRRIEVDVGMLNRAMVLGNGVLFGSVNANRMHYEMGLHALLEADADWLSRIITRRLPLPQWAEALEPSPTDVKTIIVPG